MPTQLQPKVTIGMPVYNGVTFIDHALAALVDQTYRNFTILISDNASTDGTWELLQSWAARDDRIVLHRQDTNIGALGNFRYVLDRAETEHFMWHAHDDWRALNYLEELVGVIAAHPGCALACASVQRIREDGSWKDRRPPPVLAAGPSRSKRVRALLRRPEGTWVYGLFLTAPLRDAYTLAEEFGYIWASDRIILLQFVLNDRICGADKTTIFSRRTKISPGRYLPATPRERFRFFRRYLWWHVRIFRASGLSLGEKVLCWPRLLTHCTGTLGFGGYGRFVKSLVKRLKSIFSSS